MTAAIHRDPALYPLVWFWKNRPTGQDRKGQRCRIIARGRKNNVLVEFADGYRVVTSRYAVRKATGRGETAPSS